MLHEDQQKARLSYLRNLPVLQVESVYSITQLQVKELIPSVHVPSFMQGLGVHSSMSKLSTQMLKFKYKKSDQVDVEKADIVSC